MPKDKTRLAPAEPQTMIDRVRALERWASYQKESMMQHFDLVGLFMLHHCSAYTYLGYALLPEFADTWSKEEWAAFDRWLLSDEARAVRARLFPRE